MKPKEGALLLDGWLVAGPALSESKLWFILLLAGPKLSPPELVLPPPPNRLLPVVAPPPNTPNGDVLDVVGTVEKILGFDEAGAPLVCPKGLPVVVEVLGDG